MFTVRALSPDEAVAAIPALSEILIDCVDGGASVSFQAPLDAERANRFWRKVADGVAAGTTILLVAEHEARIAGTVQVQFAPQENQPHRADVAKMLVHSRARGQGLGAALLNAAETAARSAAKTLLVLDTETGSVAERLYAGLGWTRVGIIPGYALTPYDGLCDTTFFYKKI